MLKNKAIIAFIIMVVGFGFLGGANTKLEQQQEANNQPYLTYNMQ